MAVRDSTLQVESGRQASTLSRFGRGASNALSLILRTYTGRIAFVIVLVHVVIAIIGPWITPYPPTEYHLPDRFSPPSTEYWLGTDDKGRDILSRVLGRISLDSVDSHNRHDLRGDIGDDSRDNQRLLRRQG